LIAFYLIYVGKMIAQRKKGIQTDHIAKGKKEDTLMTVEIVMKFATYSIVVVEVVSIALNSYVLNPTMRILGILIGFTSASIFGIAVYTMKDSWRAGIPDNDKTTMVTNGIYSISRNPAFVGFYLNYVGILLTFFNWILFSFTIFSIILLHLQVLKEEEYLPMVFGNDYMIYRNEVGRYIGRKRTK
jgi:protein-S-isoprenylcysteine O-methyltransferase Ste14